MWDVKLVVWNLSLFGPQLQEWVTSEGDGERQLCTWRLGSMQFDLVA